MTVVDSGGSDVRSPASRIAVTVVVSGPTAVARTGSRIPPALGAAVDPQHLARDEGAERPGEELHDARDLVHRGDALERAVLDQARRIDRPGAQKTAGARVPGRQRVDGDVVRRSCAARQRV